MRFIPIGAKKISEGSIFEPQSVQISQKDLWNLSETNPKLRLIRGSMSIPVKNGPVPVLLHKLDKERAAQVGDQCRLEGQVQGMEIAFLQSAKKGEELGRRLHQTEREADSLQNQMNRLEVQLSLEINQKMQLVAWLKQCQNQEHVLRGEAEHAMRLREDIQKQLHEANDRIQHLENQIVSERESARRREELKHLQGTKELLEGKIEAIQQIYIVAIATGALTGLAAGGLLWGLIGLGGGLSVLAIPGIGWIKRGVVQNQLALLNGQIAQFAIHTN